MGIGTHVSLQLRSLAPSSCFGSKHWWLPLGGSSWLVTVHLGPSEGVYVGLARSSAFGWARNLRKLRKNAGSPSNLEGRVSKVGSGLVVQLHIGPSNRLT